jgi:hypothetical protein
MLGGTFDDKAAALAAATQERRHPEEPDVKPTSPVP